MRGARLIGVAVAWMVFGAVSPAHSVVLQINGSGQLTGAKGVQASDGFIYDVQFVEGTCGAVFGGCDDVSDFNFQKFFFSGGLLNAAQALLDQVFLDGPLGSFDSNPALTFGCSGGECWTQIPWAFHSNGQTVQFGNVFNRVYIPNHIWGTGGLCCGSDEVGTGSGGDDTSLKPGSNWAVFTVVGYVPPPPVSTVPLPGALPLFATGLGVLGLLGWRRKRKAASSRAA